MKKITIIGWIFIILLCSKAWIPAFAWMIMGAALDTQSEYKDKKEHMTTKSTDIIEAKSALEVLHMVENHSDDTIIFLDVDDTLITPVSTSFRKASNLIDEIKQEKDQYPNYKEILSNWRLQRKIMLIDNNWPEIILKMREKFRVYGLTKMDSGQLGNIESMEEWRYKELKSLDLIFSNDIENLKIKKNGLPRQDLRLLRNEDVGPNFYNGIFFTGNVSKSLALEKFASNIKSSHLVLVDDRLEHLKDLELYCTKNSIGFTGILFKGLENLDGEIDAHLAKFQKTYLIEHATWIEDENAVKLMKE